MQPTPTCIIRARCCTPTPTPRRLRLLLLASLLECARGFVFPVAPGSSECFEEHASASDHVQGQWSVLEHPGHMKGWKASINSPAGDLVYSVTDEKQGSFDYYATVEGKYVICFANAAVATEAVNVKASFTVGDPPDLVQLAKTEHLSPIEERIKNLHESMNAVRDLQDQMREQDEAQSKMTKSTRTWLLYFTMIEAMVLVGMTVWQNLYLKSFFEIKRVV